jgi:hypothetical protein
LIQRAGRFRSRTSAGSVKYYFGNLWIVIAATRGSLFAESVTARYAQTLVAAGVGEAIAAQLYLSNYFLRDRRPLSATTIFAVVHQLPDVPSGTHCGSSFWVRNFSRDFK